MWSPEPATESSAVEIAARPDGSRATPAQASPSSVAQRVFQRLRGGRAAAAVLIAGAVRDLILGGRIKHGRGVIDRRIDEAVLAFGVAAGGDQSGFRLERVFGGFFAMVVC